MRILAVDPGPTESAYVLYDSNASAILHIGNIENTALTISLHGLGTTTRDAELLAVEDFVPYGARLGVESIRTIKTIGSFTTAWDLAGRGPSEVVSRKTVKQVLCDTLKAGDPEIRDALIHRFAPDAKAAKGTKSSPGPLYGVSGHVWAALAVAVTVADQQQETNDAASSEAAFQ